MAVLQVETRKLLRKRLFSRVVAWGFACGLSFVGCGEEVSMTEEGDTEPPRVVDASPKEGEVWNPANPMRVVFNEPVTEESVRTGIKIIGVATKVTYDPPSRSATVMPTSPMASGSAYTLTISRVQDLAGNRMEGVVTVNFTVR